MSIDNNGESPDGFSILIFCYRPSLIILAKKFKGWETRGSQTIPRDLYSFSPSVCFPMLLRAIDRDPLVRPTRGKQDVTDSLSPKVNLGISNQIAHIYIERERRVATAAAAASLMRKSSATSQRIYTRVYDGQQNKKGATVPRGKEDLKQRGCSSGTDY